MRCKKNQFTDQLEINGYSYQYYSVKKAKKVIKALDKPLPYCINILLEGLLRNFSEHHIDLNTLNDLSNWKNDSSKSIYSFPYRVLMQDFTGIPSIVDLATMKDALKNLGGDPDKIDFLCPAELVIDHSVSVDFNANKTAYKQNVSLENDRNKQRYSLLKWAQRNFQNFDVIPPGKGICHQVNLEHLARVVVQEKHDDQLWLYPDTLVGTDSHTTMINSLGILGWGVGGIEAEAAILGQPIAISIPQIVGVYLTGKLSEGIHGTDVVLNLTRELRKKGVVSKMLEFYGPGVSNLTLAQRATISNMSPEFGSTCAYFPIDKETLRYLELTGKDKNQLEIIRSYSKEQGLWHDEKLDKSKYNDHLTFDLSTVEHVIAGPKRPQDSTPLSKVSTSFDKAYHERYNKAPCRESYPVIDNEFCMPQGAVVIAAITSCTNTSNPNVLIAAALVAKRAHELGLKVKPWVKTSLAPGSRVVADYLKKLDLLKYLEALGFHIVGFGCTTCIGNSGPLDDAIASSIKKNDLLVASVLSGNRNFEGRIHALVQTNWLASPPLVVAYALAGTITADLTKDPLGEDAKGNPIYLKDLWPKNKDTDHFVQSINQGMFVNEYKNINKGDSAWDAIKVGKNKTYPWDSESSYIRKPPFFDKLTTKKRKSFDDINGARILVHLGDSVTTDHISPAGSIKNESPAGKYLKELGIEEQSFNSYGARRGNHEVMMRGTFANTRIKNKMVPNIEGGFTKHHPSNKVLSIYDAAMLYAKENVPLIVIAGKEYGSGSSRDWAAKGPLLLGVQCVIAESFERIHRTNLICMGIIPCVAEKEHIDRAKIEGDEIINLTGLKKLSISHQLLNAEIRRSDDSLITIPLQACIQTQAELDYALCGGILHHRILTLLDESKT
jgi:aconitate hydratase